MKKKSLNGNWISRFMKICDPGVCSSCQYIGDGDFLCDKHMEIVIADWVPTKNFLVCEENAGGKI